MSRLSNAVTSNGSVRLLFHRKTPPAVASSSKATPRNTNVSLRSESEADDLYPDPERQPSYVDKGEAKAAVELKKYLDEAELSGKPLPARTRVDWSDSHDRSPWSKKVILSLDGGGVKGLSSMLILKRLIYLIEEIEQGLRPNFLGPRPPEYCDAHPSSSYSPWIDGKPLPASDQSKIDEADEDIRASVHHCFASRQSSEYKIGHYFDYIAGTSTGGLSAIILGRLEMSVQEAIDQYDMIGSSIFSKPRFLHSSVGAINYLQPKYSSKRTEAVFKSVIKNGIGEELKYIKQTNNIKEAIEQVPFQGDPKRCRTMVIAYGPADDALSVDREYLFRTYDHHHPSPLALELYKRKHLNPGNAHVDPIWKIARATSAAPGYFSPVTLGDRTFHDGGMVANNPAEVALEEVSQMHDQKPMLIVSLGTGLPKKKQNPHKKPRKVSYINNNWHVLKAMTALITQSEHIARKVELNCRDGLYKGVDHHRFNVPDGMGDIVLDEWIPANSGSETKRKILELTTNYLSERRVHRRLLQCARGLVRLRRKRAATERWELFARKFVYFCPDPHCGIGKVSKTFFSRDELREHGIHEHSLISNVDVKNIGNLHHTCVFGRCGLDRVYAFGQQEELERHLLQEHEVSDPEFMTLQRMEAWLDKGRWLPKRAAERQNSELYRLEQKRKAEAVQQEGSKPADHRFLGADLNFEMHSRDGSNSSKPASVDAPADEIPRNTTAGTCRNTNNHHVERNGNAGKPYMRSAKRIQTAPANTGHPQPMTGQTARRSFTISLRSPFSITFRDSPG